MLHNLNSKVRNAIKSKDKLTTILQKNGLKLNQLLKQKKENSNVSLVSVARFEGNRLDYPSADSEEIK